MYTTHFDLLIDECRDWTSGFCGVVNFFTVVVSCELRGDARKLEVQKRAYLETLLLPMSFLLAIFLWLRKVN